MISGKKEGWPECFQDLGSWCPLPQDELHTPKVNLQDEFNFSIDGHANDWDLMTSPVDSQCDPWGNDTQFGISPNQSIEDVNCSPFVLPDKTPIGVISNNKTPNLLGGSGGKLLCTLTTDSNGSPLKTKGNVLLSQGIVKTASDDSINLLSMAAKFEQKSNKPVVLDNNDCYVLPFDVPEFASAKLNSSSLSTTFVTTPPPTPQQQSTTTLSQTPSSSSSSSTSAKKVSSKENTTLFSVLTQSNKLENISIKEEMHGLVENFKAPTACQDDIGVEPIMIGRRGKPKLKLNIAAANNNGSRFTSTLNTPEVLKPLIDGDAKEEFNLLKYVNDDTIDLNEEVDESQRNVGEHAIRDHDYITDPWSAIELKSDVQIKSEPGSPASTSCSSKSVNNHKGSSQRKRQHDYSSDEYNISDSDILEGTEDDSQQEWCPSPSPKRKQKRKTQNSSKTGGGGSNKRTSRRKSSQSSGVTEVNVVGQDKYRALRERNNEASRRSRMNRKQRDVEMLRQADDLHKKNVYLKARAEKMENLVKYMRSQIMKALTNKSK